MNELFEDGIGLNDEHLTMRFVLMILCLGTAGISFIVAIAQIQHNVQIIQLAFGLLFLIIGTACAVGVYHCALSNMYDFLLIQQKVMSIQDKVEWK